MSETTAWQGAAEAAPEAPARRSPTARAWADWREGLARWELWGRIGWHDIRLRYRGSLIGPLWLSLSLAVTVTALGALYGSLFRLGAQEFVPYLCLGLLGWNLLSSLLNDGSQVFVAAAPVIKQIRLPYSTHVLRLVWRIVLVFAHNIVVYLGVMVIFKLWPGWAGLLVLPGLALVLFNGLWAVLLLGMVCARFRDVPPIVGSVLQLAFFASPILWHPDLLGGRAFWLYFNPFYALLELIRAPLLGEVPPTFSWVWGLGLAAVGGTVSFAAFARFRARLAYWV